jgi:quinol monooxygenase YgiN
MIGVIATLKAQEGKGGDLLAVAKALAVQVNEKEDGCLQYDPFVAADDADTIVFIERYADQDALTAHGQTDYFKAAGREMGGLLAGAPDIKILAG